MKDSKEKQTSQARSFRSLRLCREYLNEYANSNSIQRYQTVTHPSNDGAQCCLNLCDLLDTGLFVYIWPLAKNLGLKCIFEFHMNSFKFDVYFFNVSSVVRAEDGPFIIDVVI